MTVRDFFTAELGRVQARFNQVFGQAQVCNLKIRGLFILAIVGLGLQVRAIDQTMDPVLRRALIRTFMTRKKQLLVVLDRIFREQPLPGRPREARRAASRCVGTSAVGH